MKKLLIVLMTIGLLLSVAYAKEMQVGSNLKPLDSPQGIRMPQARNAPEYSFTRPPQAIMTSYYDYMIGSYNGLPLRLIPDSAGGGYFMTYHGKRQSTATSRRRVFYTYISPAGHIVVNNEITNVQNNEGYPTVAVDPISGKPMYAWHANADTDEQLEVQFVSDAFMAGFAGLFNEIQVVFDNPSTINAPNGTVTTDNEFIWPTLQIGPSPIAGKRRAYVIGRNSVQLTSGPSECPLIGYADFNGNDIVNGLELEWSYISIPEMDNWNTDTVNWRRPFHALTADNAGNLYYAGYHFARDGNDNQIDENQLDIFRCSNYGEGTWEHLSFSDKLPTWNPPEAPGSNVGYYTDSDNNDQPYTDAQLTFNIANSAHLNASVDALGRVHVLGVWALSTYNGYYYPALQFVKEFVFDPATEDVTFKDVWPQKPEEDDYNVTFTPWDIEAPFGVVDQYSGTAPNQYPLVVTDWPFPHWDQTAHSDAMLFHYNNTKTTDANSQGMMAAVWQNSERARMYNYYDDANYAAFSNTPEIYISVSSDNGNNWSDPIVLNNIETPEFNNIKPMWVYPADQVIYTGMQGNQKVGKLGIMFYNDFTWGSNAISPAYHPNPDGGQVMFMEMQIVFPAIGGMGSLSGSVTQDGIPLAGATIRVANTQYTTTSTADGSYYLPSVPVGDHIVYATKHGYNVESHNINIYEGVNTVQNFALSLLPQVSVIGRIVGSDQPTVGLAGAIIELSGYEPYQTTTNAQGEFTITNVYAGQTYQYFASAPGYQTATGQVIVGITDLNMGDIIINETALPPYNVIATQADDLTYVNVSWQAPNPSSVSKRAYMGNSELGHSQISEAYTQSIQRELVGYNVYRLLVEDEANENNWILLTPGIITSTNYVDTAWDTLPSGVYKYAVNAIYTSNVISPFAFSNSVHKGNQTGTIAGIVYNQQNEPLSDVTVLCNTIGNTATTNSSGAYSMQVVPGVHSVTASHPSYISVTHDNVSVIANETTTVNFFLTPSQAVFEDGFETYDSFAIQFAPWTLVDMDQTDTYGMTNTSWPNVYQPQAFIIFVPSATTPPVTDADPHSGIKYAACFAATRSANNDWLISPQIVNAQELKLWARSYTAQFGLERFKIGVSTTGTDPADFSIISGDSFLSAPVEWTEYTYILDSYTTTPIHIAINCVSDDAFFLMVDDFKVTDSTVADDNEIPALSNALNLNYPNPFNPETTISYSLKEAMPVTIEIYNVKGQLVKTLVKDVKTAGNHSAVWNGTDCQNRSVSSGIYYYKMTAGKYSSTRKMLLMK